jgi:hypothetical protein
VVLAIRFILAEEFVCYGYSKTTDELRECGFVINYKKTYRLMKEHRLLWGRVIRTAEGASKRKFVSWRVQQACRPMEQICMDIKYVHIHGQNRNALLLTVLDVYSRSIVGQVLWWHIKKERVIRTATPYSRPASGYGPQYYIKKRQWQSVHRPCPEGLPAAKTREPGVHSCGHTGRKQLHRIIPQHFAARGSGPKAVRIDKTGAGSNGKMAAVL